MDHPARAAAPDQLVTTMNASPRSPVRSRPRGHLPLEVVRQLPFEFGLGFHIGASFV